MAADTVTESAGSWQELEGIASKILARVHPGVPASIDPNDDMLNHSVKNVGWSEAWNDYFTVGRRILDMLTMVLHWTGRGWSDVGSFLDFAAGYGRSTRFMHEVLEPETIWVSDILAPAVEFQRSQFKVRGFVSDVDPNAVEMPQEFDLISVISLLTHLPEPMFHRWLRKLAGSLAPNGIMVFTSHGMHLLDVGETSSAPFHFDNQSESNVLDRESYGISHCTREFIEQAVRQLPGVSLLAHIPRGLNGHQDVNVIGRGVSPPTEPCVLSCSSATIHIDVADLSASTLRLVGWALDESRGPVERVEVLVDGELAGEAMLHVDRPDVADDCGDPRARYGGWRFEASGIESTPRLLAVIAESAGSARQFVVFTLAQG